MEPPRDQDPGLVEIERHLCGADTLVATDGEASAAPDSNRPVESPVFYVAVFDAREKSKPTSYGEVEILSMRVDGATLAVAGVLEIGQQLLLMNPSTGKQVLCRVRSAAPKGFGRSDVAVEFVEAKARSAPNRYLARTRFLVVLGVFIAASILFASAISRLALPSVPSGNPRGIRGNLTLLGQPGPTGGPGAQVVPSGANSYPQGLGYAASAGVRGAIPFDWPPQALRMVPDIANFRIAKAQDFDPQAVSWLSGWRLQADGVLPGNYTGSGDSQAYILLGGDVKLLV